jgi:transposase InsO family protein
VKATLLVRERIAHSDVFDYIETFYNRRRRHSALAGASPVPFLQAWFDRQHAHAKAA